MISVLTAILGLAFWLPWNFTITLPNWFSQPTIQPVVISPQPTPYVFPTITPSPTPKPSPSSVVISILNPSSTPKTTPRPTVTPTPKPTLKPTIKPSSTIKPSTSPTTNSSSSFSSQQVLTALNNYRSSKGISPLQFDEKLQNYAQSRSDYLKQSGSLDNHAGFNNFIQNQDGFSKLGFNALAENQSWNYKGTANGLITEFYAKSPGHNANQLSGEYTHVGIGITGEYTNLVFGGRKR